MSKPRIAFLGLGTMGSGMARRLLTHGFPLTVFNRNPERSQSFVGEGALVATSPCEAVAQAEVVVSMVADDGASRNLWLGESGALTGLPTGTTCIESSTVTVGWVKELAAGVVARQGELLDAPVTGSKAQAAAGELNFLVGGSEATLEKVRPVLMAMSRGIYPVGPSGSGAMLKLINNFLSGVQIAAMGEAMTMIERSGLDSTKALEVLTNGAPGSPMLKIVAARMAAGDYSPNFRLRLMAKDLGYAIAEGGKLSLELATGAAALKDFQKGLANGYGEQDIAAVLEAIRKS
jgi:3-hydroxyisobutyrate dehydrogenase